MHSNNLLSIQEKIKNSCCKHHVNHPVDLIAVSKKHPPEVIRDVYRLGHRDFGENYLQECLAKQEELSELDICWHYIGHIQSNKTNKIANHFDWVQTVGSFKIAERLSRQRDPEKEPLNLCLQINVDDEESKSGFSMNENILEIAVLVSKLANIKLRGLMCIPKNVSDLQEKTNSFKKMNHLFGFLNDQGLQLDTLSMGMSGDIDLAISQGATMIRVGTAIFGERQT